MPSLPAPSVHSTPIRFLFAAVLSTVIAACGGGGNATSPAPIAAAPGGFGYIDAVGADARFMGPTGIAVDKAGNVYVADVQTIRKISPGGLVSTFAGTPHAAREVFPDQWKTMNSVDAKGVDARFQIINGITIDAGGNLYVTESVIEYNGLSFYFMKGAVRKVTPEGVVTTLVSGGVPYGVAVDRIGNVYYADVRRYTIERIAPDGTVATLAGSAGNSGRADGTGTAAQFTGPVGLAIDGDGNLYATDFELPGPVGSGQSSHTIRKITPQGVVTTIAGVPGIQGNTDGKAASALFNSPRGSWVDGAGIVYVADTGNNTIRRISPEGVVTTLAGTAGQSGTTDQPGAAARFNRPSGITGDANGNLYVADMGNFTVRKITPAGSVTTVAGAPP